jgi:hypothetical protein
MLTFLLNVQQIGFEKCISILAGLVAEAKQAASLDPAQPLQSLVLINNHPLMSHNILFMSSLHTCM